MPVQHKGDDVAPAIAAMAAAVKCGDFQGAEALGAAASYPLAIPKHALQPGRTLFNGPAATVYEALYTLPGGGAPVPVAVKRVKVRQDEDLPRFRNEVGDKRARRRRDRWWLHGRRTLRAAFRLLGIASDALGCMRL